MNDELLESVRRGFAPVHMDQPVEAIETRRRAHRRHRTITGVAAAGLTAALGVTVALQFASSSAPANSPVAQGSAPARAAFSVSSTADGKVTVVLNEVLSDPSSLEKALAEAGISAVVRINEVCSSEPLRDKALQEKLSQSGRYWYREEFKKTITFDKQAIPKSVTLGFTLIVENGEYTGGIGFRFFEAGYPVTCKPALMPWRGE